MLSINSINKRIERLQKRGLDDVASDFLKGIEGLDLDNALTKSGRLKEKFSYTHEELRALQNMPTWKNIKAIASQTANEGEDLAEEYKNKLKINKILSQANDEYYNIIKTLANYAPKTYNTAQAYGWAEIMLNRMEIGKKLVGVMRDFGSDYHSMINSGMSYTEGVNRLNEAIEIMNNNDFLDAFVKQFVNI
jgi:hypothetical protein